MQNIFQIAMVFRNYAKIGQNIFQIVMVFRNYSNIGQNIFQIGMVLRNNVNIMCGCTCQGADVFKVRK